MSISYLSMVRIEDGGRQVKLKSIRIIGMHNVVDKTYDLNSVLTYFEGPNGVGKSTILEAIQLVVLGYIPGYPKTNEGIMKHCSGNKLEVQGTFDDGTTIIRWWIRKGSSVSSSATTIPASVPVDKDLGATFSGTILNDPNVELPIYNFNEFKDMTANKMKEWFISFLPQTDMSIDWRNRLRKHLADNNREAILTEEFFSETLDKIEELSKVYSGVELIQNINTYFKSEQSFYKKEVERAQSTIQSLVKYDEELPSEDKAKEILDSYITALKERTAYDASVTSYNSVKQQLSQLDVIDDPAIKSIEDVESYNELRNTESNLVASFNSVCSDKMKLEKQLKEVEDEIAKLASIRGSICPYTSKDCAEIASIIEINSAKIAELKKECTPLEAAITVKRTVQNELDRKLFSIRAELQKLETNYTTYFRLRDTLDHMVICGEAPKLSKQEIDEGIKNYQTILSKIEANKRYAELKDAITADEYASTNKLEIVKMWAKLTDANGLQTEIMCKPFEILENDMTEYLSTMYGKHTQAHFNLSSKANSFSFGIVRNDNYIEFDCLSSGEKCLFTLAMMICMLDRSNSNLHTLLIDDLIDHLDDDNAKNVFESLNKLEDIQFIIAGVKECYSEGVIHLQ